MTFDTDDFATLSEFCIEKWEAGRDRDWSVPAGTLEWSCWQTAAHTVDCVFAYAFFLTSRLQDRYPAFEDLRAFREATPEDLRDGLRAMTTILWSVIVTADPGSRSIIRRNPVMTAPPIDFASRGSHEMVLHTHDICAGLDVGFDPPVGLMRRLRDHTRDWPPLAPTPITEDPWSDLLERSGRARVTRS